MGGSSTFAAQPWASENSPTTAQDHSLNQVDSDPIDILVGGSLLSDPTEEQAYLYG